MECLTPLLVVHVYNYDEADFKNDLPAAEPSKSSMPSMPSKSSKSSMLSKSSMPSKQGEVHIDEVNIPCTKMKLITVLFRRWVR